MGLLVPSRIADERLADEINAEVDRIMEAAFHPDHGLQAALRAIDPTLSLFLMPENVDPEEWRPGYWYVRKRVTPPPDEFFCLEGPGGERIQPGLHVLDMFRGADLWNPRVHRDRQEAREKLRRQKVRAKQLRAEQRIDEGAIAGRAAKRVAGEGGMTKRAWGRGREGSKLILPAGVERG